MTAMRQPLSDTQVGRSNSWMTTFNDMMTLLMVFFVLLFSMGRMDVKRFENFQNALQSAMGVLEAGRHAPDGVPADRQGYAADPQAGKTERLAEKENFQILADQQ
ncbi:MAG: flagellar motor protein MotB, partial [Desulfatitalea sp.]|nr:flagellar motor protein MotB [Desulfatitalea sp.]